MSGRHGARTTAAGIAALALAGALGCAREQPAPLPEPRTTIIGLDGADWRIALPLMRQGKLPVLSALRAAGTSGVMLTNPDYSWSPVLWTSVATGKLPDKHGVTSFMARVPGLSRPIPTPSTERKVRALWNMFTERGRTVGFVGWWVTWPAETVNGFMVTDHFSVSRFDLGRDYERDPERAFEERQTYPEALAEAIAPLKVPRDAIGRDDLERFADLPDDWRFPDRFEKFDAVSEFAIAHSVDRTHLAVGTRLLAEFEPELFGVFIQGIDIMQHYFWEYMDPGGSPGLRPDPARRAMFGESIERYYRFADEAVERIVDAGGDDRAVLIVSDHGFRPSTERYAEKNISGEHRRQSFYLHAGPGIRRGRLERGMDAVDVAPTVLAYHGLPVGDDMDGEPLVGTFTSAWRAAHPLATIPTWETGEREVGELPESSVARDLEERISALGYIE